MKPFKPVNQPTVWNAGGLGGMTNIQRPGSSATRSSRPLAQISNADSLIATKKTLPKVGSSIGKKKKTPPPQHNFLEPLVELRPASNQQAVEKPYTETYKQLQAQLAKSHRKSQKLNLIRNSENNSNYFPSFYEPTQAQILEAENRKNDALLQIYTDSGTFSKVVAMTVAASVLDTKLPYDVVQYPLDNKKREELMKFCHDVSSILGIPDMKSLDSNDYRRLWHLFSIFTNAMDQRICSDPARCPLPEDVKNLNGNVSASLNGLRSGNQPPKKKTLEETSSDGELIETIKSFNPNLYHALRDPLERFLIVYGRYVDLGHVKKSANLRHNVLNDHIQRYHERVAYNMPTTSPLKHPTNNASKMSADGKRPSEAASYLEKTKASQQHAQFQNHIQNSRPHQSGSLKDHHESTKSGSTVEPSGGGSVESSESSDDKDGSDQDLSKSRKKRKDFSPTKKKKGPVPSWVQAYHRSEQQHLWNLIKIKNDRGQASVTPLVVNPCSAESINGNLPLDTKSESKDSNDDFKYEQVRKGIRSEGSNLSSPSVPKLPTRQAQSSRNLTLRKSSSGKRRKVFEKISETKNFKVNKVKAKVKIVESKKRIVTGVSSSVLKSRKTRKKKGTVNKIRLKKSEDSKKHELFLL